jgi:hypothetical protein
VGGCYYLPYQPHATPEQFHAAYPRAQELFAMKRRLDPDFRLRNVLWDKYYAPTLAPQAGQGDATSSASAQVSACEFRRVFSDVHWHDRFYKFLQNVYRIYPEDRFHTLIKNTALALEDDEAIYRRIQRELPAIKPPLADLTMALPALFKQKREMATQTLQILGAKKQINGYAEIGSTGRYISELRKHVQISGPVYLVNDVAPGNSPVDIAERGGLAKIGSFVAMDNYAPISSAVADASLDLVTCYIGLHHSPLDRLDAFVQSIVRVLRPGGVFLLRDHDVVNAQMNDFVSLVHTVFNAGLNETWETNTRELRHFRSVAYWVEYLQARGLQDMGLRLLQTNDPSDNVLLGFVKGTGKAVA